MAFNAQMPGSEHESALDANALLTDLDKGLRSTRPGEQCEAIVRFPWLFERYPFPILINSASLKLAELFRNGSNFCRLLILKVIQQTEKHLDKISNADEFVRRLFAVSYSNDPVARAVTLRALAAIASIASDRKNIHHCIRDSLDSHDEIEVSAAIDAAAAYAQKSEEFALHIHSKVIFMIHRLETLPELKIRLLSVLHHEHYDPRLALQVREDIIEMLSACPSEDFVCAAFKTLTLISATSLSQIPSQVSLLLSFFAQDDRRGVKKQVLNELLSLSRSCPHLWDSDNVIGLISIAERYVDLMQSKRSAFYFREILKILSELIKCPCLLTDSGDDEGNKCGFARIVKLCLKVVYGDYDLPVISLSFSILSSISGTSGDSDTLEETVCAIQAFIVSVASEEDQVASDACTKLCQTLVRLGKMGSCVRSRILTSLRFALLYGSMSDAWIVNLAETISAIGHTDDCQDFASELEQLMAEKKESSDRVIVSLLTVYFQTLLIAGKSCQVDLVLDYLNSRSFWTCYQVARQAIRYGHHSVAHKLCNKMCESASSESCYFWMMSLSKITNAETCLYEKTSSRVLDERLSRAIALYVESGSSLRAMITSTNPLSFQTEYLQLRLKSLQAHECLRQACKLVRTSPAPAIASSTAMVTRDDLMKYGAIVTQMRKSAKEFRILSEAYSNLFQSSFNADNQTLAHLQLLQSSCTMMAEAIESLFQTNRVSSLIVDKNTHLENTQIDSESGGPAIEHRKLIQVCHEISFTVSRELSGRNVSKIEETHIRMLEQMSQDLLSVPLSMPRLFFQSVQQISVKLAVSPQPKIPGDLVIVMSSMNFALKVEGVIVTSQQSTTRNRNRSVAKVMLNVTTSPVSGINNGKTVLMPESFARPVDAGLSVSSVVVPKNEYFSTQFLLHFGSSGIHTITVEASIIDENEAQWRSGHVVTSSVKVVEDGIK